MAKDPNSKNIKHNRGNSVRVNQIRRDNDNSKDTQLGLYDIDETIKYYFDNIVKLQVTDSSGVLTPVPVSYASPENWKSLQKSKINRDSRGKIQLPFLVFKRDSMSKNRELGNKVDPNKPLYHIRELRYNKHNRYDKFAVLNGQLLQQGRQPVKIMKKMIIPDHVTVTYSCMVFTEFLTQMNHLIESISYAEGSYWGDKNRFLVRAKIDDFPSTVELSLGSDRIVKSEFQININGHLIPKNIQQQAAIESSKTFTKAKIVLGESVTTDINDVTNKPQGSDTAPFDGR